MIVSWATLGFLVAALGVSASTLVLYLQQERRRRALKADPLKRLRAAADELNAAWAAASETPEGRRVLVWVMWPERRVQLVKRGEVVALSDEDDDAEVGVEDRGYA